MSAESNPKSHIENFSWWQGNPQMTNELNVLADLAALRDALDELLPMRAREAYESGATWTEVGAVLGISKQAASKRFRRPPSTTIA